MNIIFRADASLDIGTGHVMRCLTLAEALRDRGANCRFVCREHPGNLLDLIRQRGFEVRALPMQSVAPATRRQVAGLGKQEPAHAAWLGADWTIDAEQTRVGAGKTAVDWLVVDHYAIDARWEHLLRSACGRLMVIDDLADRPHDCDLLLDQNLGRVAANYAGLVPPGCSIFVGPKYALLRPEFAVLRSYSLDRRRAFPQLKNLLISMGGVDKGNATGQVLDALHNCALPEDCSITVVMGSGAPWLKEVRQRAAQLSWKTEVLVNVQDMAKLMADSDIAIGAAGSTSWERCCMGLPSIVVVLAANQQIIAQKLEAVAAAKVVQLKTVKVDIEKAFRVLFSSSTLSAQMSAAAAKLTCGSGANSVGSYLVAQMMA